MSSSLDTTTEEPIAPEVDGGGVARRKLLVHDSLAFLTLLLGTAILFGLTLLLFRSFTAHRNDLARRWADRGAAAMRNGRAEQAVGALRTALTYAPDDRTYELLLAQALGEAGRTDESYNYFMTLWGTQPGSGFINLELARLEAKRGNPGAAAEFYRASIYGTWEGDGVVRRSEVRLELARYLIDTKQYAAARMELLTASGNAPETAQFDLSVGALLSQAHDIQDASTFYDKAATAAPRDTAVLETAGRFAYGTGNFESARRLLGRVGTLRGDSHTAEDPFLSAMRSNAARITELLPGPWMTPRAQADRILVLRRMARKRLDACTAQMAAQTLPPAALEALTERWSGPDALSTESDLRDPDLQNAAMHLVYDTERITASVCSAPNGDDALLLLAGQRARPPASSADPSDAVAGGSR